MLITYRPMRNKWLAATVVVLIVAQLILVFVSWFLEATMTVSVRPLLSAEGLRWFLGSLTGTLATPWLVWLLLLSMAWGSLRGSRLLSHSGPSPRRGIALRLSLAVGVAYIVVVALMCLPGGILLSATVHMWPSPFSRALVPLLAFGIILVSVAYGVVSRSYSSFGSLTGAFCAGISSCAPLFVLYVLALLFCESLRFVFF